MINIYYCANKESRTKANNTGENHNFDKYFIPEGTNEYLVSLIKNLKDIITKHNKFCKTKSENPFDYYEQREILVGLFKNILENFIELHHKEVITKENCINNIWNLIIKQKQMESDLFELRQREFAFRFDNFEKTRMAREEEERKYIPKILEIENKISILSVRLENNKKVQQDIESVFGEILRNRTEIYKECNLQLESSLGAKLDKFLNTFYAIYIKPIFEEIESLIKEKSELSDLLEKIMVTLSEIRKKQLYIYNLENFTQSSIMQQVQIAFEKGSNLSENCCSLSLEQIIEIEIARIYYEGIQSKLDNFSQNSRCYLESICKESICEVCNANFLQNCLK